MSGQSSGGATDRESEAAGGQDSYISAKTSVKREGSPLSSDRIPSAPPFSQQRVPSHNPKVERLPKHPTSHPAAREAEREIVKVAEEFENLFLRTPYGDEEVSRQLDICQKRKRIDYDKSTINIVVRGMAGEGKTATLNSLIGFSLGNTSGGLFSVTNVIQTFRSSHNGQTAPFKVQIFIYTKVYVLGQLEQMLRAFRLAASKEDDDDEMAPDEESESAHVRLIQYCADLFAFRQECSDRDAAEEFLSEKSDSELLSCFDDWLALIYQELIGSDTTKNKIVKECVTVQSVNKFIAPFVCSTPEPSIEGSRLESCPYPVVEAVEVAFNSRMLGAKNILKDVPGLGDTNTLHVDRAHMALKDADKIMLVFKKTRIVNNKKLYGAIRDIYRTRGAHGVFLVITHCADLAEDDDTSISFTVQERVSLASLSKRKGQMGSEIRVLIREEGNAEDLGTKRRLDAEIRAKRIERNAIENRIFESRVLAQNRTAVTEIHGSLASSKWWKSQEKLIIVCVDNEEYAKHARGFSEWSPETPDEAPRLSLAATGIPELRRIITEFPANGRWESLNHHVKNTWRCTLEGFHLSGSVTKAQRKAQVDEEIMNTREALETTVNELFGNLDSAYLTPAKTQLVAKQKHWEKMADKICEDLANTKKGDKAAVAARTHFAILKNSGAFYSTKGEFNVNKTLLSAPLQDIDTLISDLRDDSVPKLFQSLKMRISHVIDQMLNKMDNDPQYDVVGVCSYMRTSIRTRKNCINTSCIEAQKELIKALVSLHECAAEPNAESGYIAVAMQKVYDKAIKAKKKSKVGGIRKERHRVFQAGIKSRNGPFHQLRTKVIETIEAELQTHRNDLIKKIKDIFAEIQSEIDYACTRKEDNSKEGIMYRKQLREMVRAAQEKIDTEICPKLDEAFEACRA